MIETSFKNSQIQNFKIFQKRGALIRVCVFIRDNTVFVVTYNQSGECLKNVTSQESQRNWLSFTMVVRFSSTKPLVSNKLPPQ